MKKIFTLLFALFTVISLSAAEYYENFETLSKNNYLPADVTLKDGMVWTISSGMAGSTTSDWKVDGKSLRLAGVTKLTDVPKFEMKANKAGGIGNVSFQYAIYGTDPQISWLVEWSADGTTWTQIGEIIATADPATFSYSLNEDDARIRIIAKDPTLGSSTNGKRMNLDEVRLTDNDPSGISQEKDSANIIVVSSNGSVTVTVSDNTAKTIDVFNLLGQKIISKSVNKTITDINNLNVGEIVIVKVGDYTQKVLVK